jgi:hypothetical protein
MRRVRLETAEPFLKRRATVEGVLLSDLDDYKVQFKVPDVRSSQVLLATRADGKRMPVDRSGPIRIVFPDAPPLSAHVHLPGRWTPWP